ncbi:MAG: DUF2207 domain-containing protein, partial [Atopobiaceae bacterium]|nr:DUF2207 domain-containing protein [Atopobiaceae bacterium]
MRRILHRMRLGMRGLLACVLLACLLVACLPATAWADDDYDLTKTDIGATVGRDGLLYVTEERTLDLDGDFHGFYWQIDTGPGELGDVSVEIREAGEVTSDGSLMPYRFVDGKSGTPGIWTMEQGRGYTRVDVHYEKSYEEARFYVTYALDGVAERFADTGELYWKFVGDRWEKDSSNVTCTVYFEGAPAGTQVVAGENLRGWLHNESLQGLIEVGSGTVPAWDDIAPGDAGTLTMTMPMVHEGEFAEVRATFPEEWLDGATQRKESRLEKVLTEEAGWADAANARFERATLFGTIKQWILNIMTGLTAVMTGLAALAYRRSHKAVFDDKYFRDVPTDDHPAVLYYVDKSSAGDGPDFTASLMRLSDMGVIVLEKATYLKKRHGRKPKEKEDWLLRLVPEKAEGLSDPIDQATIDFVFGYVAQKAMALKDDNERQEDTVFMSDFERVATREEERYEARLDTWKETVTDVVAARGLNDDKHEGLSSPLIVVFGLDLLVIFLCVVDSMFISNRALQITGMAGGIWVRLGLLVAALVGSGVLWGSLPDRSDEAIEINAKLDALRRWLKDFTRLEEAVPTDIVLWDRLLVMSVVLGVSDRVIEQLKLAAPQLLESTSLANTVMWCDTGWGDSSPASSFSSGFSGAAASASGSGGGASGGGGGGGG